MYHDDLIYLTDFLVAASERYKQQEPDWVADKTKRDQVLLYAESLLCLVGLLTEERRV